MTLRTSLALVLALGVATPAARALDVPDIPSTRYVLPNGLTLIVHEDHKAPVVAVNVWYHVGSKNEKPGRTGFAHLFEHLMFQPSEHLKSDVINTFEALGATDLNGTTSEDRTNYFETVPVTALDTALFIESDRMGHLAGAIDQKKLDLQRGVVQNEKRQGENQPYGKVDEVLQPLLYPPGHPYSWTVIGSMADLSAASLDDVKEWFKTYYGPSNATLVVAGDVTPADVKARVEKYFGHIPPGPPLDRPVAWVARRSGEQRVEMQDRVPQARLHLVWNTAQWGTQDDTLLGLGASVLSSGKSSRLYKRLVYDEQLATSVSAMQGTSELGSTFVIQADVRPGGDPAAVEQAIKAELARFMDKGPTADELERVRTARLARFIRGVERVGGFGGKSDVLAEGQVFGGDPAAYRNKIGWLAGATPAQVRDAGRRWLADGVAVLTVRPYGNGLAAFAPDVDRSVLPVAGPQADGAFPALRRATLSNGLSVVVVERHAVPVVNFDLLVDAGYASDAGRLPGTAQLAMALLDEGTATRSSLQISDELQRLGAALGAASNLDQSVVSLNALKANLDASLALYADVVLNPGFPQDDFARLQKLQLAGIEQELVDPSSLALRLIPGLIYGSGHPYGNPLTGSGTTNAVKKLTRDDLRAWWSTWFKPDAATLLVVGDTTLEEITPKLERAFGRWQRGEVAKKAIDAGVPAAPGIYLVDRPGSQQSLILMGTVAPPRNNPGAIGQEVMNNVFGGLFSSRLNMNLREDKHWTYGAQTLLVAARGPRPYLGFAPVQTDKTSEALAEFIREVHGIRGARPVTATELAAVQAAMTLKLAGRWETAAAVARSTTELLRFGLDDRYWDGYAARVRQVDLAAIRAAAQFIDPGKIVWVVVGDRAKIEAGLAQLGLGAPKLLDGDGRVLAPE
jgi:zinc protease